MLKSLPRVLFLCLSFIALSASFLFAQQNPVRRFHRADRFAISPPLRELALSGGAESPILTSGSSFAPGLSFLGLGHGFPNFTVSADAPDSNLAAGSSQVVQWANIAFAIFDKSTGAVEAGPLMTGSVWQSLGGACASGSNAASELIVQWDRANQRWVLSQNTLTGPPYETCVAVSTSSDATGTYYLYAFSQGSLLPESPKWGVWSNGYYQTQGEFTGSGYVGPGLCAYNSAKLVVGDGSAEQICFTLAPADGLPLPADIDSGLAPPANEDEFFLSLWDPSHLSLYSLHPDYQNPQNSSVTGTNGSQLIAVPAFTPACNGAYDGNCVPQKDTSNQLQVLGGRLMYRVAYWEDTPQASVRATPPRPLPSQHWYVVHDSTAAGGNQAPRWYEFTAPIRAVPVTSISLFQSGTFAPDSNHRWMGSIARDKAFDLLLGYSESSASMYPSIAVTGRVLTDPLGTMEPEVMLLSGSGSQLGTSWGNFSSMRLDPDGCTFWYTNEYYTADLARDWSTQLATARFSGCQ